MCGFGGGGGISREKTGAQGWLQKPCGKAERFNKFCRKINGGETERHRAGEALAGWPWFIEFPRFVS